MHRRFFLSSLAALGLTPALLRGGFSPHASAPPRPAPDTSDLTSRLRTLVDAAMAKGATYADARFIHAREHIVSVQQQALASVSDLDQMGWGLRVYKNGGWGYVSIDDLAGSDPATLASRACTFAEGVGSVTSVPFVDTGRPSGLTRQWSTPMTIDPFAVPLAEKRDFLLSLTERAMRHAVTAYAVANLFAMQRRTLLVTSRDVTLDSTRIWTWPNFAVTAYRRGVIDNRAGILEPISGGYEITTSHPFTEEIEQAVFEVGQQQNAAILPKGGTFDLILEPSHLWRVLADTLLPHVHPALVSGRDGSRPVERLFPSETIGSSLMLSPAFTLDGTSSLPGGLTSGGWDDSGRETPTAPLVTSGIITGLPVGDELESAVPGNPLRGTRHSDVKMMPLTSPPDLVLRAPASAPSRADLIAGVTRGFLIAGRTPTQLSPNQRRFKASGQRAWYIENGKIKDMVRDIEYEAGVEEFWRKLIRVGSDAEALSGGEITMGSSPWAHPFTVRTPPAVFRDITVLSTREDKS